MREEDLIPYQATDLRADRILVLAAHPDDEILGAGGTLALNAERSEAIRTWVATDGTSQEGILPAEEAAYGERRRQESIQAAEILGLPPPLFAGLPDRGLDSRQGELQAALETQFVQFRPDLVLCPSPVEIHPDHRALAEVVYEKLASSRPEDADHDRFRFLTVGFYEISHPILPNTLVDIASVSSLKDAALAAFASQQSARDYGGALKGLNSYRRLTLSGEGPVEAFRVVAYPEASTRSLEEFRRSIGPSLVRDGLRGPAPVAVVVRTRNRPSLLREALESLRAQTARPERVVIVNDGGASPAEVALPFRDAFSLELEELPEQRGRSAAANLGVEAAREELVAFLDDDDRCFPDHLERLARAQRAGPEPVVYSDAVTVIYEWKEEAWQPKERVLQYSLDFDPDYLLLANFIPLHTLLLPRALFRKVGGFDPGLEYSEDWDFLIRLSAEASFRHVRGVTCEYRVFEEKSADPSHVAAGAGAFQEARRRIYERYSSRRSEAGLARVLDRLRAQIAFWYGRDGISQGELRYQRESHRRLDEALDRSESRRREAEARDLERQAELARLRSENELARARLAELFSKSQQSEKHLEDAYLEIERLNAILNQIYASRTWKLHLFLDRLRGRR